MMKVWAVEKLIGIEKQQQVQLRQSVDCRNTASRIIIHDLL